MHRCKYCREYSEEEDGETRGVIIRYRTRIGSIWHTPVGLLANVHIALSNTTGSSMGDIGKEVAESSVQAGPHTRAVGRNTTGA